MAKKGQTFKKHSKETKEEILRKYFKENQSASSSGFSILPFLHIS